MGQEVHFAFLECSRRHCRGEIPTEVSDQDRSKWCEKGYGGDEGYYYCQKYFGPCEHEQVGYTRYIFRCIYSHQQHVLLNDPRC